MDKDTALAEFKKMWQWLKRHPAHGREYYVKHVAKVEQQWLNDCPLCEFEKAECLACAGPESMYSRWDNTSPGKPHDRSWYATEIIHAVE